MQPSASQARPILQHPIGRRRLCDADDGEDYCPTVGSDAEYSEKDDVVRPPRRKRRRVSTVTVTTGRTASQRQTRPDRGDSLSREARRSSRRPKRQGKRGAAHPPSSRESTLERDPEADRAAAATFEEWPLGNAALKRVIMDGSPATFVVQFTWDPYAKHGTGHHRMENRSSVSAAKRHRPAKQRTARYVKDKDAPANSKPTSRRERYSPKDDKKIRQMKEQGLSWIAIAKHFPGRTAGAIEARYHAKLKTVGPCRNGARRLCDYPRAPSAVADDLGEEEEFPVEEICGDRKLDDGGVELLVKWKGGEETWEPYENLAETEALDRYERLHGQVSTYIA
ncbi:hypothetical protein C8A03DRAFT_19323 [Achaetomium macrosporum]|uniref:Chromo domain-containing protein n=1 Tax=Achaetomium macrosporum TaxID=79813 RepID=A0AAN7C1J7_9PEZI|nr:hypothetical protein C8A03DRAFT_19323 [Achaetomium macrosporum]